MEDWRESLFVWKGIFIINNSCIEWKGTWVSTNDAINDYPTIDDFQSSKNDFLLNANITNDTNNTDHVDDDTMNISFNGYYLLDNGNGLEKYHDIVHDMICIKDKVNSNKWYCYAKGDTEFGQFISKGILIFDDNNTTDGTLTLARRYVYSKKDTRLSMPLDISVKQMISELSSSSSSSNNDPKPWENLPMKEKKQQKRKRNNDE